MPDRITRIAIFEKQGLFGVISVDTNVLTEDHGLVHLTSSFEIRCGQKPMVHQPHATDDEALRGFADSVALSLDRDWSVLHNGPRNHG